jgi:tetratricopeptide (TPR) repeat protein
MSPSKSWWLALVLWCITALAAGQQPESKANKDRARAHFRQGVTLVREGAYKAALVELKRAYELSPDYRVLFNIGQTQLELGDYVASIEAFEAYLSEGGENIEPDRRADVEVELAELRKRVATLEITANLPGVVVAIDGVRVGETPLPGELSVSVGRHQITGTSPDGRVSTEELEVAGGDVRKVRLELATGPSQAASARREEPSAAAPEREGHRRRQRAAIGLFAGGGALGVGALVTGLLAKGAHDDHEKELEATRGDAAAIAESRDDMKLYALSTDLLAAGAAALVVTGFVLVLTARGDDDQAQRELKVGVGPARLTLEGRF